MVSALNRLIESENTQEEWNFLQQHFSSFFTEKKNINSLRATILQLALDSKLSIINEDNEIEIGNLIEFSKNGFQENQIIIKLDC